MIYIEPAKEFAIQTKEELDEIVNFHNSLPEFLRKDRICKVEYLKSIIVKFSSNMGLQTYRLVVKFPCTETGCKAAILFIKSQIEILNRGER